MWHYYKVLRRSQYGIQNLSLRFTDKRAEQAFVESLSDQLEISIANCHRTIFVVFLISMGVAGVLGGWGPASFNFVPAMMCFSTTVVTLLLIRLKCFTRLSLRARECAVAFDVILGMIVTISLQDWYLKKIMRVTDDRTYDHRLEQAVCKQ